jgi:hypothetical protein
VTITPCTDKKSAGSCHSVGGVATFTPPEALTAPLVFALIAGKCGDEIYNPNQRSGEQQDFEDIASLKHLSEDTLAMHQFFKDNPSCDIQNFIIDLKSL